MFSLQCHLLSVCIFGKNGPDQWSCAKTITYKITYRIQKHQKAKQMTQHFVFLASLRLLNVVIHPCRSVDCLYYRLWLKCLHSYTLLFLPRLFR